jgi:predicted nucleic acid-binding protein
MTSPVLLDTSTAVPLLIADHPAHDHVVDALSGSVLGLAGHAAFETYSVLTRLPAPARRTPVVATLLRVNFPESRYLPEADAGRLLARLPALGVSGGSVYDALVGAVAVHHALPLATRDARAADVYAALGVDVDML